MKIFTKWFIFASLLASGAIYAGLNGIFNLILVNDASYISLICLFFFVGFSVYVGKLSFDMDKGRIKNLSFKLSPVNFLAEHFLTLGLIGTTAGLCYTINKALKLTDTAQIIAELKNGLGRTLYSTIIGLICSLLLQVQSFIIQHREKSEKS